MMLQEDVQKPGTGSSPGVLPAALASAVETMNGGLHRKAETIKGHMIAVKKRSWIFKKILNDIWVQLAGKTVMWTMNSYQWGLPLGGSEELLTCNKGSDPVTNLVTANPFSAHTWNGTGKHGYKFFTEVEDYGRNKLKIYTHKQSMNKTDVSFFSCFTLMKIIQISTIRIAEK